jgi:AraC-like DNA-binding protein
MRQATVRQSTLEERRRLYLLARATIARHYRRPLTLERVARALASSPRQLTRAYAHFGQITFREDLFARRMRAAAQLLIEQPAIPVRDVARIVGYRQPPHFAKAFRRRYGLTPAAFRAEGAAYARAAKPGSTASLGGTTSAPGSSNRMSVPPSAAGSARTVPPCCSATCRTIARPRPEPGRPRASALR